MNFETQANFLEWTIWAAMGGIWPCHWITSSVGAQVQFRCELKLDWMNYLVVCDVFAWLLWPCRPKSCIPLFNTNNIYFNWHKLQVRLSKIIQQSNDNTGTGNNGLTLPHFENGRDVTVYFMLGLKCVCCCQVAGKCARDYKKMQLKCLHASRDFLMSHPFLKWDKV